MLMVIRCMAALTDRGRRRPATILVSPTLDGVQLPVECPELCIRMESEVDLLPTAAERSGPASRTEWAYREVDTGREAVFTNVELVPLSYDDLIDAKAGARLTIPLNWGHAEVVRSDIPGITSGQVASVKTSLETDFASKGIGLVPGGWLPSGLAVKADTVVLLDRCIVADLLGRFRVGVKQRHEDKDFLDLFNADGNRINPILYALEGKAQECPTREVIRDQLEWAANALQSALPKAHLVAANELGLQGVMGLLQEGHTSIMRERAFLLRLAPYLAAPISRERQDSLWKTIVADAKDCGVKMNSLVVLAALSAASVVNGKSPARRMLKFRSGYSLKNADNALADLRSIKLLMSFFALFPKQRAMLCTSDRDMALFWLGIRASDFRNDGGHASFSLSPTGDLLPGNALARWLAVADSEVQ